MGGKPIRLRGLSVYRSPGSTRGSARGCFQAFEILDETLEARSKVGALEGFRPQPPEFWIPKLVSRPGVRMPSLRGFPSGIPCAA